MLRTAKIIGFVATTQPEEAKRFYEQCLGLRLIEDTPFALVFETGNTTVRIQKVETLSTPPYTTLGWEVTNIAETVEQLSNNGVEFERFTGLPQNDAGIWQTPDGAQIAWFKDTDGNTLSITQAA